MKSKKLSFLFVLMSALASCTSQFSHSSDGYIAQEDSLVFDNTHVSFAKPLQDSLDLAHVEDGSVAASFEEKDIHWDTKTLTFTLYTEDLYDSGDLTHLEVGDTILFQGGMMKIEKIDVTDRSVTINGGLQEGGVDLRIKDESGVFVVCLENDYSTYTSHGSVTLPFDDEVEFVDCGDNPTDESKTYSGFEAVQKYYNGLDEARRANFTYLNTDVMVQDGKVRKIIRSWIP